MQETIVNEEIAKLDLSKVAAIQQKRTLAFVNHFVITTVQFLNNFMKISEQKLMQFERKLEKIEAAMVLLEARLSSIPEVNKIHVENKEGTNIKAQHQETVDQTDVKTDSPEECKAELERTNEQTESNTDKVTGSDVKDHPQYERFIKMVNVGVPLQAVKLKVNLEGLDPNILEKILNK